MSGGTGATTALDRARVAYTLHPYVHDPANQHFGDEAVAALGLDARRVFKTLVVACTGGRHALAVAVVPVAHQLDLKALARAVGAKRAQLADQAVAERTTGYVVGGISPLGQRKRLPTVVDETATGFETVVVSAGRRGLQLELSPADLVAVTGAVVAPVAARG